MNVVDLDGRRRAAAEAETAATAYLLNRQAEELAAIRRARVRRIGRSRITWSLVTMLLCGATAISTYQFSARPTEIAAAPAEPVHAPEASPPKIQQPEPAPPPVAAESGGPGPVVVVAGSVEEPREPLATIPAAPTPAATITLPTAPLPAGPMPSQATLALPKPQPSAQMLAKSVQAPAPSPTRPAAPVPAGRGFVSFEAAAVSKPTGQAPAQIPVQSAQTPGPQKPAGAQEPTPPAAGAQAQAPTAAEFAIVGAPTDEVILIRNKGEGTVRPVRLGQPLPNGEIVLLINPAEGRVRTDRRTVQLESK